MKNYKLNYLGKTYKMELIHMTYKYIKELNMQGWILINEELYEMHDDNLLLLVDNWDKYLYADDNCNYKFVRMPDILDELLKEFPKNNYKKSDTHSIIYTYIMTDCSGLYKIGRSYNPKLRLSILEVGNPSIILLYSAKGDFEKEIHNKLTNYSVGGEWYDLQKNVLMRIVNEYQFNCIE